MSNAYLDKLEQELLSEGVNSLTSSALQKTNEPDDLDLRTMLFMQEKTGMQYSDEQKAILKHRGNACILACAGSGKALKNGTGVLTPNGYVPVEQLKVGDIVYDECGYPQKVMGVYPQGQKKVYIVKFNDDTEIECCKDHLWAYQTYNMRRTKNRFDVKTLEYIKDNVPINVYPFEHKEKGKQNRANIYIPVCEPVQFEKKQLPLKPYLLGALLGDGSILITAKGSHAFTFTNEDKDVVDRVNEELGEIGACLTFREGYTYSISTTRNNKLRQILSELGLLNKRSEDKFIPDIYKLSSVEDRLDIIKGLIDTDGSCNGTSYDITLKSERLIDDMKFILETLGMTANKYDKEVGYFNTKYEQYVDCGTAYRLYIKTSDIIPKIHYSQHRESQWKTGQTSSRRTIVSITETDNYADMTCIRVSGLSELFLTEHCIVTHNTTVSTHLIAKRILTGEISNTDKLIYTTYSKAGSVEMKERLDKLFQQLGINKNIQVRTLHSFFLQVLRTFGINAGIIKDGDRAKFIRESCKEAEFQPKDDDLMLVDQLLSYQVNNLLSDKKTIESYINTLDNLSLEQYSKIRNGYAQKKNEKSVIDYDDMQSYLYLWLCKYAKSKNENEVTIAKQVRDYCQAMWTDFYIDEAQDVSKIQFAIIRAMITPMDDPDKLVANLVFIGDDDQCYAGNTVIKTLNSDKWIKDIEVGDKVVSFENNKKTYSTVIEKLEHVIKPGRHMVKIITRTGLELNVTDDNKTMVTIPDSLLTNQSILYKNKIYVVKNIEDKRNITNDEELESLGFRLDMPHGGNGVIKENGHTVINAMSAVKGMIVSIYDNDRLISDVIESVEIIEVEHPITVYDINLDKHHNFIANNVLSHNCIYEWRGSDPSIILSVGPTFDMRTFVLSTNYRCKSEIVDYATTGIKCNSKRYAKSMKANVSGGTVKIAQSAKEDLCSLSILAMNQIKYWIDQGDSCKDIAVLSRNNFHLALLSNMLLREGIYCNMTEDMKLTKSYMYKDIRQLITISEPSWKPEITANVLWKLCRYMSVGNARVIANFQNNSNLSLSDTLGYLIKHFINKGIDFNKAVKVSMQAEEQMKYYMGRMSSDTIADLTSLYELLTCGNRDDCLRGLMEMYRETTVFIYKSSDKKRSLHGLCLYIRNLLIKDGFDKMVDFLRITEQFESGNMGVMGEKVTLTTIHSAKGREWKNVIMFGCDNISQPSFDGLRGMEEDGIAVNDIFESIDEERRLFYVGNTRAKENLFVITYKIPSVFILEALGIFGDKDEPSRNNGEILEYVNDNNRFNRLQERILDMLAEKGSKYHYDPEDYKLK